MIITIASTKGGVGKSTIATNIAGMMAVEVEGRSEFLFADADPQRTSTQWCEIRHEMEDSRGFARITNVIVEGKKIRDTLRDLEQKFGIVIVDAGGKDNMALRQALLVSDRVYIPVKPYTTDVMSLDQNAQLIDECKTTNPDLEAYIIINDADTNPRVRNVDQLQEILAQDYPDLKVCNTIIHHRKVYSDAFLQGCSVTELNDNDKANKEMQQFYKELLNV